ncbi:MAG: DNA mismatch repair protein MutS [Myxococcales bacterium]|nr:DNA mismatch repair protein MutS [Myxococcales bacterium]MCB9641997.1 DNA mismatch repair protein MutS [Myxococcales bacterium]
MSSRTPINIDMEKLTPMMRQYMEVKLQYPEAILFFRMGDFFEMFYSDAEICSDVLNITLTARNKSGDDDIPMAGIPHHAHRGYVNRLVEEGHTVVICDQVEDAKLAKGLVRREVTRIVTPGMVLDPDDLDSRVNLYIAAVFFARKSSGLSCLDLTTGEFRATELPAEDLLMELQRIQPREVLMSEDQRDTPIADEFLSRLDQVRVTWREGREFAMREGEQRLSRHFQIASLEGFGIIDMDAGVRCASALLGYVQETQKNDPPHISKLVPYQLQDYMVLDQATLSNLEILESMRERTRRGSLFGLLDRSVTGMGGRKLKQWLLYPLLQANKINRRLDVVERFVDKGLAREDLRGSLKQIADLERLNGKVSSGIASPKDLVSLGSSLEAVPQILQILSSIREGEDPVLAPFCNMDPLGEVSDDIRLVLNEDAPALLKDPGFVREGYDKDLDEQRDFARNGKQRLDQLLEQERQKTGIRSLGLKFHKNLGYSFSVTKANKHLVPDYFRRKQTLVNEERFTTEELDDYQLKIMGAEERAWELEQDVFFALRSRVMEHSAAIGKLADQLASLDALSTLAEIAVRNDYVRPELSEDSMLEIEEGRHPVVEHMLPVGTFVSNNLSMHPENGQFILLTGPNMSGKSTIMRQAALIALMAQIGSFIPARQAKLGLCDRIFTRVGASDNLASGQSTFMVEMTETANILHNATSKSLVILDEIGRGTSTFDGISIAWAVAEFLHNRTNCRTLFATHYHELTELEHSLANFRNMSIAVQEQGKDIAFLHRLVEGGSNHSYGIQVARLAGMPAGVVRRATRILTSLEEGKLPNTEHLGNLRQMQQTRNQMSLFAPVIVEEQTQSFLEEELEDLNLNDFSPMEALQLLYNWKKRLAESRES